MMDQTKVNEMRLNSQRERIRKMREGETTGRYQPHVLPKFDTLVHQLKQRGFVDQDQNQHGRTYLDADWTMISPDLATRVDFNIYTTGVEVRVAPNRSIGRGQDNSHYRYHPVASFDQLAKRLKRRESKAEQELAAKAAAEKRAIEHYNAMAVAASAANDALPGEWQVEVGKIRPRSQMQAVLTGGPDVETVPLDFRPDSNGVFGYWVAVTFGVAGSRNNVVHVPVVEYVNNVRFLIGELNSFDYRSLA